MLRTLLADRFRLSLRRESKKLRAYVLTEDKRGFKLRPSQDAGGPVFGFPRFHGDLNQFCAILSIQLTIPTIDDPTKPARATGPPVPVLNRTALEGIYDIRLDLKPEPGGDIFTLWQRRLQEQLGLKLENQRTPVEILVIDRAERIPTAN
jgi:uncharacterized protein (TIGR03435 family)